MSIIGTVVMIAAGIGAVLGIQKSKSGAAWGRPVAVVCACLTLALAAVGIKDSRSVSAKGILAAAHTYNGICGETLGNHLAQNFNGSRVLVLTPTAMPVDSANSIQTALVDGLKKGMGSALTLVDTVEMEPPESVKEQIEAMGPDGDEFGMMDEMLNYEVWFDTEYFVAFLEKHKGTYDVLVSTVGLPIDMTAESLANVQDLPEIAMLNASTFGMKDLVADGTLDAVVMFNPAAGAWKESMNVPDDPSEAFAKRYVLVTTDNVADVAATHPNLF